MQKRKEKINRNTKYFLITVLMRLTQSTYKNLSTKNHAFRFAKKKFFLKTLAFLNSVLRFKVSNYSLESKS